MCVFIVPALLWVKTRHIEPTEQDNWPLGQLDPQDRNAHRDAQSELDSIYLGGFQIQPSEQIILDLEILVARCSIIRNSG